MNIHFFYEETAFRLNQIKKTKAWISKIINLEKHKPKNLNYIFCSDKYLLSINKKHLNHHTLTDIITFDNSSTKKIIDSDIFISIERVQENSHLQKTTFKDELARVMIHGILHLTGWSDKTDTLKKKMRIKENSCLSLR